MHDCTQEPTIQRIDKKLDKIDEKIDKFLERQVTTETKVGFITSGFLAVLAPLIVGIILYLIRR